MNAHKSKRRREVLNQAIETLRVAQQRLIALGADIRDNPGDHLVNVLRALAHLKETAAREQGNLMHPIIEAARAHVTMGEMCDALREIWGIWRETPVF